MRTAAIMVLAALAAGCAAPPAPVRVTRFHLGAPIDRVAVAVAPDPGSSNVAGLEAALYERAIAAELAAQGFGTGGGTAEPLLASFSVTRTLREIEPARSPVTIGIGGGSFGGGVGGGGSLAFGVGKKRGREAYVTELAVQLRRRPAGDVVWEGRAQTSADTRAPEAQPEATARKLSRALFQGFPGESGRTISVR